MISYKHIQSVHVILSDSLSPATQGRNWLSALCAPATIVPSAKFNTLPEPTETEQNRVQPTYRLTYLLQTNTEEVTERGRPTLLVAWPRDRWRCSIHHRRCRSRRHRQQLPRRAFRIISPRSFAGWGSAGWCYRQPSWLGVRSSLQVLSTCIPLGEVALTNGEVIRCLPLRKNTS